MKGQSRRCKILDKKFPSRSTRSCGERVVAVAVAADEVSCVGLGAADVSVAPGEGDDNGGRISGSPSNDSIWFFFATSNCSRLHFSRPRKDIKKFSFTINSCSVEATPASPSRFLSWLPERFNLLNDRSGRSTEVTTVREDGKEAAAGGETNVLWAMTR